MTEATPGADELELVVFKLGDEEFAVEVAQVQEVIQMPEITRHPGTPDFIKGLINLRGKILPIIDLRERLNLPAPLRETPYVIITDVGDQFVGMIVDAVTQVVRVPASSIEPPPPMIADVSGAYLRGIGRFEDRLLILIDLSRVLSTEEVDTVVEVSPEAEARDA